MFLFESKSIRMTRCFRKHLEFHGNNGNSDPRMKILSPDTSFYSHGDSSRRCQKGETYIFHKSFIIEYFEWNFVSLFGVLFYFLNFKYFYCWVTFSWLLLLAKISVLYILFCISKVYYGRIIAFLLEHLLSFHTNLPRMRNRRFVWWILKLPRLLDFSFVEIEIKLPLATSFLKYWIRVRVPSRKHEVLPALKYCFVV